MAFLTLTEDETIYCLAAISRITSHQNFDLINKLQAPLTVGELHASEKLYRDMRFSPIGDTSVKFNNDLFSKRV